jgi:sugar phosphate isomerase/epimerase
LTVRGISPSDQIECARQCGYSHVGLRFLPVVEGEILADTAKSSEQLRATQKRLADTGIGVLDVEFFWIKPHTHVADYEPYFAAAERLGARNLLAGASDPDPRRLADHWLEFCELAARYHLRATLEFMPFPHMTTLNTYAAAIIFVKSAPHANGGITIDSMHFDRSGSHISEILPEHNVYFTYMQLCDAPAGQFTLEEMQRQARSDRLLPGRGGLNLIGLLNALPIGLPISLEVPLAGEAQNRPASQKAQLVIDATRELLARLPASADTVLTKSTRKMPTE